MRCGIYVRVSTDDQRDNGYSIDSQLRMIKEYCEKNEYDIVDVYNDAGHSGKDLMRPEMQRLLKDIKSKKIDKLIAIKVDRLTRNNYDGFWLLNYCEEHDVKIELILEPYDVSTANGEMIFGMNLVFGQRERKEIGARTKRAMEEMALERIHPSKAPYGYIRNKETGHLEVEPIEAEVVKEIFELCKQGNSTRGIATIMKDNNAYLKQGKDLYEWTKKNLEDPKDHLYFDNIALNKKIGRAKFAYNSGQMMQAAALLYQITKQRNYLEDAQNIAEACHKHFFTHFTSPNGQTFQLLKKGNIWFTAVMLRGFIELYQIDHNKSYLTDFQKSLDYAWHHARDERGLFHTDWSGTDKNEKKWLLTQAAFIEMYGRLGGIDLQ